MFRPLLRIAGLGVMLTLLLSLGLLLLVTSPVVYAQPNLDSALPTARLVSLMPCGGKLGTTVEVTFTGIDLEEPEKLIFSHPNIKAEIIIPPAPMVDPKNPPKTPPPPVQPTKAKVTIGSDVPPGFYDARIVGKWGVSSPRIFVVGDLDEIEEKEPNSDLPQAQKIQLNTTVNGTLNPATDVDYFQFAGKKGQRVLVSALTSSIDSRATPAIELYSLSGRLLGNNRNYNGDDALVDVTLPDDGEYYVRLYEFTHTRGTPEHFYRLSVSTGPWIDSVFPCIVEPGKTTNLTVYGRNLPGGQPAPGMFADGAPLEKITVPFAAPGDEASKGRMTTTGRVNPAMAGLPGVGFTVKNGAFTSNVFPLTFATLPVVLDADGQRTEETAQVLTPPCEVAGHLLKKGERDWYALNMKKGETVTIDLASERLGAATFIGFTLRKPKSQTLLYESQDNPETIATRFYAHSEDPVPYKFTAPEDGKFLLQVQNKLGDTVAGPRQFYRLRVGPDRPDFQIILQSAANTRPETPLLVPGGRQLLTVMAIRRDGFTGDIALEATGLPPGVTCPPTTMPGSMKSISLVLQAPAGATPALSDLVVKGTATIDGKPVVREAIPACMVWPTPQPQQPTPAIARVSKTFPVAIRPGQAAWDLGGTLDKAAVHQGDKATLTIKATRNWPDMKQPIAVQTLPGDMPTGLTVNNNQPVNIAPDKSDATMPIVVGANTPPGVYLLPVRSSSQVPFNKDPMAKQKQPTNILIPGAVVTLEVLPKTLAKVNLSAPAINVKMGAQAEIGIKLERQYGYTGEFKVEVVLPPNTAGVTFDPLVIPAGKDDGKLIVKVPQDAKEGPRANLIVRTTALYGAGKVPTVQDAPPLTVTVTK
jgi:hypothetical protein